MRATGTGQVRSTSDPSEPTIGAAGAVSVMRAVSGLARVIDNSTGSPAIRIKVGSDAVEASRPAALSPATAPADPTRLSISRREIEVMDGTGA